jgi:hypothetical protein
METTDAEKRKALRAQLLLLVLMFVMISAPIAIFFLRRP